MLSARSAAAATGYADTPDSREAGAAAARAALDRSGLESADLAVCFHHGRHDARNVLAAVRSVLGERTPVVGGTAMGIITNDALGYEGHQVGVAVIGLPGAASPQVFATSGLRSRGEREVGSELASALVGAGAGGSDLLLLYSSIKRGLTDPDGLALHFGTPLVAGLLASLERRGTIAGAGLIDSFQPSHSHVFTGHDIDPDGAVAVTFGDGVRLDTAVLHGCRPLGGYHRITRVDGPVVLEIDGRPALDVIDERLGGAIPREDYPFRIVLGLNRGERFAPFHEDSYQPRLCLAIDEDSGGLVMFEPDLEAGSEFQLMRFSPDLGYVRERVEALLEQVGDRRPLLAIYADCAGRSAVGSGMEEEEGDAVREALGDVPLLGFYTGVEVAAVRGEVRPLDWTGVLCLMTV